MRPTAPPLRFQEGGDLVHVCDWGLSHFSDGKQISTACVTSRLRQCQWIPLMLQLRAVQPGAITIDPICFRGEPADALFATHPVDSFQGTTDLASRYDFNFGACPVLRSVHRNTLGTPRPSFASKWLAEILATHFNVSIVQHFTATSLQGSF